MPVSYAKTSGDAVSVFWEVHAKCVALEVPGNKQQEDILQEALDYLDASPAIW